MAKKKLNTKAKLKKVVKKASKLSTFSKVLFVIFVLVIVSATAFLGIKYNKEGNIHLDNIEKFSERFNLALPKEAEGDLVLPTKLEDYPGITISWESSNEAYLTKLGKVTRPTHKDGSKVVSLTAIFEIESDFLSGIFYNILGFTNQKREFKITVQKLEMTSAEKLEIVASYLYVPSQTSSDIALITTQVMYPDIVITWTTSDETIIKANGEFVNLGEATLTAKLELDSKVLNLSFAIELVEEFNSIFELDENFKEIKGGTATKVWNEIGFTFDGVNLHEKYSDEEERDIQTLRLNTTSTKNASFSMDYDIESIAELTLIYQSINRPNYNQAINLNIYMSVDEGDTWVLLNTLFINNNQIQEKTTVLSSISKARFKVELVSDYASEQVLIYGIRVSRKVYDEDIKKSLSGLVYQKVKNNTILPLTTPYGGIVSWVSSDSNFLNVNGLVTRAKESKVVNLIATILVDGRVIEGNYTVTIIGTDEVSPVEIFFIDIGKYGTADAGESIYIRIDEIDILVDAGQHSSSFDAIVEVIDENSLDKTIDYLIATHPDADHIGNMDLVFSRYDILNVLQFYGDHTSQIYKDYFDAVKSEGLISECTVTDSILNQNGCTSNIELKEDVFIDLVDTLAYKESETNSRSIVFVLEAYGTRVLLTGDADNGSLSSLEAGYMNKVNDIDILKAVHHGTKEGTTSEFLAVVDPEVVIITNGNYFGNKHGHPTADAINRVYKYDSEIEIYAVVGGGTVGCSPTTSGSYKCDNAETEVDRNGTIKITIDNNGYEIVAELANTPIELSSTTWWKNHPDKEYSYSK